MSAYDILTFAVKSGLTAADLKEFSLGFIIDFCVTKQSLEKGDTNTDEEKYLKLKDVYPFIVEDHENGKISDKKYTDFILKYKSLEERYGWDY